MIAPLMLVAIVVATLVAIAARATDALARLWRVPARNVWSAAIVLAVTLPIALVAARPPIGRGTVPNGTTASTTASGVRLLPTFVVQARTAARDQLDGIVARVAPLDRPLMLAWLALSAGAIALLVRGVRALRDARPRWRVRDVDGERVLVAPDVGPAVVGVLRPTIVLPEWALALDAPLRALVLRHEREHVQAGDPRHLALGALGIALMPWNPALWWMLRRQRTALEIDCDARVLAARPDVSRYGLLLLAVAQRRSMPLHTLAGAPALAESTSDLSRRIDAMRSPLPRRRGARTALGLVVGSLAVVGAVAACSAARDIVGPRELTTRDTASARELPQVIETALAPTRNATIEQPRTEPDVEHVLMRARRGENVSDQELGATLRDIERARGPIDPTIAAPPPPPPRATQVVDGQPYFEFQVEEPVSPARGTTGPRYPEELRRAGVRGTVLAQFVVDTLGRVEAGSFKELNSDHADFTASVRAALATMQFEPARIGGHKVKQLVQQPFHFEVTR